MFSTYCGALQDGGACGWDGDGGVGPSQLFYPVVTASTNERLQRSVLLFGGIRYYFKVKDGAVPRPPLCRWLQTVRFQLSPHIWTSWTITSLDAFSPTRSGALATADV